MSIASEIARLQSAKSDLKTSINAKGGTLTTETLDDYAAAVDALPSGGTYQTKTVTPDAAGKTVTPDAGYDALSSVTINGDSDLTAGNIKKDVVIFGTTGTYEGNTSRSSVEFSALRLIPMIVNMLDVGPLSAIS